MRTSRQRKWLHCFKFIFTMELPNFWFDTFLCARVFPFPFSWFIDQKYLSFVFGTTMKLADDKRSGPRARPPSGHKCGDSSGGESTKFSINFVASCRACHTQLATPPPMNYFILGEHMVHRKLALTHPCVKGRCMREKSLSAKRHLWSNSVIDISSEFQLLIVKTQSKYLCNALSRC